MSAATSPRQIGSDRAAAGTWDADATVAAGAEMSWGRRGEKLYSRRVFFLKRALPAIGCGLLLAIALWPRIAPFWDRIRLALPVIDLREARELRMLNPRHAGIDRLGRPYIVTAHIGRQVPDRQDLMSMEAPRADIKTHSGANVVITALTGVYQQQAQLLDLFGEVVLLHDDGTRFTTQSARVDVAHNAAAGSEPVEGHGPSGDIRAQGFRIEDKGDTIIFLGQSDLLLNGAKLAGGAAQPPAMPPRVEAIAEQVQADVVYAPAPAQVGAVRASAEAAAPRAMPADAAASHSGRPTSAAPAVPTGNPGRRKS